MTESGDRKQAEACSCTQRRQTLACGCETKQNKAAQNKQGGKKKIITWLQPRGLHSRWGGGVVGSHCAIQFPDYSRRLFLFIFFYFSRAADRGGEKKKKRKYTRRQKRNKKEQGNKKRKAAAITVYPRKIGTPLAKTLNVFCLDWHHMAVRKRGERGERNPPYELRHHSKYSHTLR